jgi:hypothetical protein
MYRDENVRALENWILERVGDSNKDSKIYKRQADLAIRALAPIDDLLCYGTEIPDPATIVDEDRDMLNRCVKEATDDFLYEITDQAIEAYVQWLEDHEEDSLANPPDDIWISTVLDWNNFEPGECITAITDQAVPIYNSTLLRMAADNVFLALSTPEIGPAFDGEATPINIIAANVYEHIEQELWEVWHNIDDYIVIDPDYGSDSGTKNLLDSLFNFQNFTL